jgi:predicted phage terminase large subunit-like protein
MLATTAAPDAPTFDPCPACGETRASCAHRTIVQPFTAQLPFLASPAFESMYGGGKGSGKTRALILAPLYWVHHGAFRALLLRREWKQAARTLLEEARKVYPKLGAVWWAGRHVWRFPSGAEIEINGCDNDGDEDRYYGTPELSFLGIDQLEHFTRKMYLGLISCVRSAAGLPLVIRSTANPGGIGLEWLTERFAPWLHALAKGTTWEDPNYTGRLATSTEVLWYRTTAGENGEDVPCERTEAEPLCEEERRRLGVRTDEPPCAEGRPCSLHRPRSRQYVHAVVSDNPYTRGTQYERNLLMLDPVERAWFLSGNWMVRAKPGSFFRREWIPALRQPPGAVICRLRYWDRAATREEDARKNTAWTAGVRLSMLTTGLVLVEHVQRGQWDPGHVDREIVTTADGDPTGCVICIEEDGGQAGKAQVYYDARMLAGRVFAHCPPVADKITRMRPASSLAQAGGLAVLAASWNEAFYRELEGCPSGLWDQIDSLSGGLIQLLKLQEQIASLAKARALQEAQTKRQRTPALAPDGGSARLRW